MRPRTSLLGLDWLGDDRCADRSIDPYLIWADLTDYFGVRPPLAGRDRLPPSDDLRLALELDLARAGQWPAGAWQETTRTDKVAYGTLTVPLKRVAAVLRHPAVRRAELGFSGLPPRDHPAKADLRPADGTVVAVIDFGCAFAHERFRHAGRDGRHRPTWHTRIRYLWDQGRAMAGGAWSAVPGFGYGGELTHEAIDALLAAHVAQGVVDEDAVYAEAGYDHVAPALTHGTHVLDLAAGAEPGVAPDDAPSIIFVQLPDYAVDDTSGGSMVTHAMDALRYIVDRVAPGAGVAVNLSYGSLAGPHDGSTLLESAMDALVVQQRRAGRRIEIVLPAGNGFDSNTHARLDLCAQVPAQRLLWQVQSDDPTDTFLEVWYPKAHAGRVRVTVTSPAGETLSARADDAPQLWHAGTSGLPVAALIHRRHVAGGLNDAMALVALAPTRVAQGDRPEAPAGVWNVDIELVTSEDGAATLPRPVEVHAWIERDDPSLGSGLPPRQSCFLPAGVPLPENELGPAQAVVQRRGSGSSIANGRRTVVVGACVADAPGEMASYSACGWSLRGARARAPNLVAPGDDSAALPGVLAAGTRSGMAVRMNGTSVAAPQVTRRLAEVLMGRQSALVVDPSDPPYEALRAGAGRLVR